MSSEKKRSVVDVVGYCGLKPSEISLDYVRTKKQFQLHTLITEQRHKKTFTLSQLAQNDVSKALSAILSVDEDITDKLIQIADDPKLTDAVMAMKKAMKSGRKIYYYG